MTDTWPDLVVGIDLGTTGTAVAFAKPTNSKVSFVTEWPGEHGNQDKYKVPSIVALNEQQELQDWGFDVMSMDADSISKSETYKLFKPRFDSDIPSEARQARKCVQVFLKALYKHLKESLAKELSKDKGWDKSKIKFVFSYPTTWGKETQARFSEEIKRAGFPTVNDQPMMTSLDESQASLMHFISNISSTSKIQAGQNILLADIGGATSDVSIHKLSHEDTKLRVEQMVCSEGEYLGSTYIDDKSREKLRPQVKKMFEEALSKKERTFSSDYTDALAEGAVLHVEYNPQYSVEKHRYQGGNEGGKLQKHKCHLWFPCPPEDQTNPQALLEKTQLGVEVTRKDFFEDSFKNLCEKIWEQCRSNMEELGNGGVIDHVVLSGGFGRSPYLLDKLTQKFAGYAKSKTAPVVQIRDAQLAVCSGLVHDELSKIHGSRFWVYPVRASYGIRKKGNGKESIKWFLTHGSKIEAAHTIKIERQVRIDKSGNLVGPPVFQLVKIEESPPKRRNGKDMEDWESKAGNGIEDVSLWIEKSLPDDLKGNFLSSKVTITITAIISRGMIVLTLQPCKDGCEPCLVREEWHAIAEIGSKHIKAPKSKVWKSGLSTSEKIAGGALLVGLFSAIIAATNKFNRGERSAHMNESHGPDTGNGPADAPPPADVHSAATTA